MHPARRSAEELLKECLVTRTRRSGPGGQHRNKVETAIVLKHRPTELMAEAAERRSQKENQQMALWRLRIKLALEVRSPAEEQEAEPSELWKSRLQGTRIVVSGKHEDFPALLAEAFDTIEAADFDLPTAAERLRCTASQLVKLLAQEPAALVRLNSQRAERGLRPLK